MINVMFCCNLHPSVSSFRLFRPDIWFDDVDEDLLEPSDLPVRPGEKDRKGTKIRKDSKDQKRDTEKTQKNPLVKDTSFEG